MKNLLQFIGSFLNVTIFCNTAIKHISKHSAYFIDREKYSLRLFLQKFVYTLFSATKRKALTHFCITLNLTLIIHK